MITVLHYKVCFRDAEYSLHKLFPVNNSFKDHQSESKPHLLTRTQDTSSPPPGAVTCGAVTCCDAELRITVFWLKVEASNLMVLIIIPTVLNVAPVPCGGHIIIPSNLQKAEVKVEWNRHILSTKVQTKNTDKVKACCNPQDSELTHFSQIPGIKSPTADQQNSLKVNI